MIYFNPKKTPLYCACVKNNSEIALELLKKHNIDVNKSHDGRVNTKSNWIKPKRFICFFCFVFYSITGMGE